MLALTYLLNTVFSGMIEALVRGQAHLSATQDSHIFKKRWYTKGPSKMAVQPDYDRLKLLKLVWFDKHIWSTTFLSVLQIRIHMFLGLLDPHPDPSVRGMDPDPAPDLDPSITKQKK